MAHLMLDGTTESTPTLPGLRAWLQGKLSGLSRRRRGDTPTRYTDEEIRDLYYRTRGHRPVATDAMTQLALRAGFWGRY